jgi:hypothetical protein
MNRLLASVGRKQGFTRSNGDWFREGGHGRRKVARGQVRRDKVERPQPARLAERGGGVRRRYQHPTPTGTGRDAVRSYQTGRATRAVSGFRSRERRGEARQGGAAHELRARDQVGAVVVKVHKRLRARRASGGGRARGERGGGWGTPRDGCRATCSGAALVWQGVCVRVNVRERECKVVERERAR